MMAANLGNDDVVEINSSVVDDERVDGNETSPQIFSHEAEFLVLIAPGIMTCSFEVVSNFLWILYERICRSGI
jgi:hypothetical protein